MFSIPDVQAELGRVAFTVVVLGVLVGVLLLTASFRRRGAVRTAGLIARVVLGIAVVGALSLTLFGWQSPTEAERVLILNPIRGAWGWDSIAWRPVYDNVALFVPVGALATAVWWRRSPAFVWLCGLLFSAAIETFQYLVPTGRVANTADLVANGVGALIGILIAMATQVRKAPRRRGPARQPERQLV